MGELIDLGTAAGIVQKSGTWYSMKHPTDGEIRLGQGLERSSNFLGDNPDLAEMIEKAIFAKFAPPPEVLTEPEAGAAGEAGAAPAPAKGAAKGGAAKAKA